MFQTTNLLMILGPTFTSWGNHLSIDDLFFRSATPEQPSMFLFLSEAKVAEISIICPDVSEILDEYVEKNTCMDIL